MSKILKKITFKDVKLKGKSNKYKLYIFKWIKEVRYRIRTINLLAQAANALSN